MQMMNMMHVFVYGTLKRGHRNHHWALAAGAPAAMQTARLLGFELRDVGPYPAMLPAESGVVHGEIFSYAENAADALVKLDELEDFFGEGHPNNLYERISVTVEGEHGPVQAYAYIWAKDGAQLPVIEGGVWHKKD